MRRSISLTLAALVAMGGVAPALATPDTPPMATVLADPARAADAPRDVYRHPAETLAFFRVQPGMTVVDVMPGSGWYTRVLLPYLGEAGRYVALGSPAREPGRPGFAAAFPEKAKGWRGSRGATVDAYATDTIPDALDGTVDRVLIMREVHNLVNAGTFGTDLGTYHRLLKRGGMLGIEEHRAKPNAPDAYANGGKGYMRQADVIRMVEASGFKLVATSEINANPKDTADYPEGVWTLPPSLTLKDQDRAKYQAIGESDRMTLLFAKR